MDNICHTLVGAACAEAGLKTRTRFATPVLLITANLPDVDVLAFATSTPAVAVRRGLTHGILAQALLPIAFTVLVLLVDRWRPPRGGGQRARAAPLLLLSYVGVLTHVGLDWLNNYGVRLLMPFSDRWSYGDSVFIVDPWLWLVLGLGVLVARRTSRPAAAGVSLILATIYIAGMVVSARRAREHVLDAWMRVHGAPPRALMVGPAFANPFRRAIILHAGDHYRSGRFHWQGRRVVLDEARVPLNADVPAAVRARDDPRVRAVLVWARFPFYRLAPVEDGTRVTVSDMRFAGRVGDVTVLVPHDVRPEAPGR